MGQSQSSPAGVVQEKPAENDQLDVHSQEDAVEPNDVEASECEVAQATRVEKPKRRRGKSSGKNATLSKTVEETLDVVSDAINHCVEEPVQKEPVQKFEQVAAEPNPLADIEQVVSAISTEDETVIDDEPVALQDDVPTAEPSENSSALLAEIIATNTAVLQQVVEHISQQRRELTGTQSVIDFVQVEPASDSSDLVGEIEKLAQKIDDLYQQLDVAQAENGRLESELSEARVAKNQPAQSGATANQSGTLTWEQRKEQMFKEMEEDSFDAESFIETIQTSTTNDALQEALDLSPEEYVLQLNLEFDRVHLELQSRDEEVSKLQRQLQSQSSVASGSLGADTAIEDLVDVDSLLKDERERLQAQQKEWEGRFRDTEIATSLERAKLSRERRELARQNAELQEQLIHIRRDNEVELRSGAKGSRRWLAMLGLSED